MGSLSSYGRDTMRTEQEMLELILHKARRDDRIRGVLLSGSRVTESATHDKYSDFDIIYIVDGIQSFTKDKDWYKIFGEILIMQLPEDWYAHPYNYGGNENFAYLMQFTDGNRIDLTLIDKKNLYKLDREEPRKVLLDKDECPELYDIPTEEAYYIKRPGEFEYFNCCNEFWWLTLYAAKGLCRDEFHYVRTILDHYMMPMLVKLLNWRIGLEHDFHVSTGHYSKYLKRFLSEEEMHRFRELHAGGRNEEIWTKLEDMMDYFEELALCVGKYFNYTCNIEETVRIKQYIRKMKEENERGK
jgi:aminoglycoside 6-adenylyltransferase